MYVELYHELKLKNGLSMEHVFNKSRSLRGVQRPNTIEENREMLSVAGFKDIDIFFKWANFTAFLAMK
jgi:tRNA (cmo5U34)-methyltransferase